MKRRARLGKLEWALIVASAFVVLLAIGVIISPDGPTSAATQSVEPAPAEAAPPAEPEILLSDSGHGDFQTATFYVEGDWDLNYAYDQCSHYGGPGVFAVDVEPDYSAGNGDVYVGQAYTGTSVTHEHGSGRFYLSVISTCSWSVRVTELG